MKKTSKRRGAVFEYAFLPFCKASAQSNHYMSLVMNLTAHSLVLFFNTISFTM